MALKAVTRKLDWRAIKTTAVGSSTRVNRPNGMPKDEFERLARQTCSNYKSKHGIHTKITTLNSGNALRIKIMAHEVEETPTLALPAPPSLAGTSFDASVKVAKQAYVAGFLQGVLTADPAMLTEPKRLRVMAGDLIDGMPV